MKKLHIILLSAALLLAGCTRDPEITDPAPLPASSGLIIKAACTAAETPEYTFKAHPCFAPSHIIPVKLEHIVFIAFTTCS